MRKMIVATLAAGVLLAGCGSSSPLSDAQVAKDLGLLLQYKGLWNASVAACSHQQGDQYVCQVNGTPLGTVYPSVTDDGKNIYAVGF